MSVITAIRNFFRKYCALCTYCHFPTMGTWAHNSCIATAQADWDEYSTQQDAQDAAEEAYWAAVAEDYFHLEALMASFCDYTLCFEEADPVTGLCTPHTRYETQDPDDSDDEQDADNGYDDDHPYDDQQDDLWDDLWDDQTEDPLAGDVEPTGGYYVPPLHPWDAQRREVMRRHGDCTDW